MYFHISNSSSESQEEHSDHSMCFLLVGTLPRVSVSGMATYPPQSTSQWSRHVSNGQYPHFPYYLHLFVSDNLADSLFSTSLAFGVLGIADLTGTFPGYL